MRMASWLTEDVCGERRGKVRYYFFLIRGGGRGDDHLYRSVGKRAGEGGGAYG